MSDFSPIAGERPLRGGKAISAFYYKDDSRKAQRRLYNDAPRLPLFKETPGGPFLAYPSRLLAHLEALSIAREQELAEAALRATEGPTSAKPRRHQLAAPKSAPARSRKPSAPKAVAARKAPPPHKLTKAKSVAAE